MLLWHESVRLSSKDYGLTLRSVQNILRLSLRIPTVKSSVAPVFRALQTPLLYTKAKKRGGVYFVIISLLTSLSTRGLESLNSWNFSLQSVCLNNYRLESVGLYAYIREDFPANKVF